MCLVDCFIRRGKELGGLQAEGGDDRRKLASCEAVKEDPAVSSDSDGKRGVPVFVRWTARHPSTRSVLSNAVKSLQNVANFGAVSATTRSNRTHRPCPPSPGARTRCRAGAGRLSVGATTATSLTLSALRSITSARTR